MNRRSGWRCPKCHFWLFSHKKRCLKCNVYRGDWICPTCKELNFRHKASCLKCGTEHPGLTALRITQADFEIDPKAVSGWLNFEFHPKVANGSEKK